MRISDCKKEGRLRLKTRTLRAFRITLCTGTIAVMSGAGAYYLPDLFSGSTYDRVLIPAAQIAFSLLTFSIMGTMRQGMTAWLYCSACGKEPSGIPFFYWLRKGRGLRAAWMHTVITLRKAAWTMLLCAPGIAVLSLAAFRTQFQSAVVRLSAVIGGTVCLLIGLFFAGLIVQKYALAPILFAKAPQKGMRSAVRGSCFLMDDSCMRLYLLKLSFLPWAIAAIAVLPLVYILPYYKQTTTCMLRSILRAHTL